MEAIFQLLTKQNSGIDTANIQYKKYQEVNMKKQAPQPKVNHLQKLTQPLPRLKSVPKPSQSQPKNIKKPHPPPLPQRPPPSQPKQCSPPPTAADFLNSLSALDIQHMNFEQCWQKMITIVDNNIIKMVALFPESSNQVGEQLLKNGKFLLIWLKIIEKNTYLNTQMVYKNMREKYLPNITSQKQQLELYINQKLSSQQIRTPGKFAEAESLKRSILKSKTSFSEKKVQFGADQIIYPVLHDYQSASVSKAASRQNMVKGVREKHGFLLDFLEINLVYFLNQVQIVGEVRDYEDTYSILLVREKDTNKQVICIGVTKNQAYHDKLTKILEKIDRDYQNLAYLELQGKNPGEIWLNSLSTEVAR